MTISGQPLRRRSTLLLLLLEQEDARITWSEERLSVQCHQLRRCKPLPAQESNPIQRKYIPNLARHPKPLRTACWSLYRRERKRVVAVSDDSSSDYLSRKLLGCPASISSSTMSVSLMTRTATLRAEKVMDKQTSKRRAHWQVFDKDNNLLDSKGWILLLGKYSDMPSYPFIPQWKLSTIFECWKPTNNEVPLHYLSLFHYWQALWRTKAMEQFEGMIGTLRVFTSRLATKESYWIFHKDGDDFDLKVSQSRTIRPTC